MKRAVIVGLAIVLFGAGCSYPPGESFESKKISPPVPPENIPYPTPVTPTAQGNVCTQPGVATDIGSIVYPISDTYAHLSFLGQLFTAAECGNERMHQLWGVENGKYTRGLLIVLKKDPSITLLETLKEIGFDCIEKNNEMVCKESNPANPVSVQQLLKLIPFASQISRDDCVSCG